jgi:hypothetical protein
MLSSITLSRKYRPGQSESILVSPPNCEQFYCGKKLWLSCDGAEIIAADLRSEAMTERPLEQMPDS